MGSTRHRFAIRADAGRQRGAGHVMRCLTLATELTGRGHRVELFSVDLADGLRARAVDAGVTVHDLAGDAPARTVVDAMTAEAELIVLDGYHLGDLARAAFASGTPVMLVDDNGELPADGAALILNQNLQADESIYAGRTEAGLLLGPRFAMVRADVAGVDRAAPNPRDVLVAIGGTDPLGLTLPLTEALLRDPDVHVWLARGAIDAGPDALADLARAGRVSIDPGDLATAFAAATVAVIGGGSMMWEVAHLGLPSIVLVVADNQHAAAVLAAEQGFALVHDARNGVDAGDIADVCLDLLADDTRRAEMGRRGRALIDGDGTARVVDALEELLAERLR